MGKNLTVKTPGWFSGHHSRNSTIITTSGYKQEIPSTLPTYSWTLTPIPNCTCSVMTVPIFDAWLPSTWLTNYTDPSTRLQSPNKKVLGCKVLQFIPTMKIKKMLGHKTQWCTYTTTSSQEWWTRAKLFLWSQFAWTNYAQCLCNLWTLWRPLKQSFYMSRVRRKEGSKTHSQIPGKHNRISISLSLDR